MARSSAREAVPVIVGESSQQVIANFQGLKMRMRATLPRTRILRRALTQALVRTRMRRLASSKSEWPCPSQCGTSTTAIPVDAVEKSWRDMVSAQPCG